VRIDAPGASRPSDYDERIFDQGHLAPNADMALSDTAVINSFVMSNMAPQYCQFNRGVWQILESIVRLWAKDEETLFVISGSVFDGDGDNARDDDDDARRMKSNNGQSRVAVPTHFYKVLAFENSDGVLETLSILLPHDQTDLDGDEAFDYLADHVVTLADIEAVSGVSFFPGWTGGKAEADGMWVHSGTQARSLVFGPCRLTAGAHPG
jgi:endonuclease G